MRINSNMFLISYALFLFISFILVTFQFAGDYVDDLISGISIASTLISFAELFYTKVSIEKSERKQLTFLYETANRMRKRCMNEINEKYKSQAMRGIELYEKIFDENERNIIENDKQEFNEQKEKFLKKIEDSLNEKEDKDLVIIIIKGFQNEEIKQLVNESDEAQEKATQETINESLLVAERKEETNLRFANFLIIIGFTLLLVILTVNAANSILKGCTTSINNSLTVLAFFSMILNLLLKDNYRAKSLKKIQEEKRKLQAEYSKK
ncbi:hypothetical protein FDB53_05735 [Clostridium botulinum]|nr:hypothetical protein [Clostridium botulinum]